MGNVYSILGHPYILPVFQDRKTRPIQFDAILMAGGRKTIKGFAAPSDLVLHRTPTTGSAPRQLNRLGSWTISEPRTGYRVVVGRTRQDALDTLAKRVAHIGGMNAFKNTLQTSVSEALKAASETEKHSERINLTASQ